MKAPERKMKIGFESLSKTRNYFEKAIVEYEKRNSEIHADKENVINIKKAIHLLNQAYDEVSAIWENDIIN